jgi:amino acid permease
MYRGAHGATNRNFIDIMNAWICLGSCVAYFAFLGPNIEGLVQSWAGKDIDQKWWMAIVLVPVSVRVRSRHHVHRSWHWP